MLTIQIRDRKGALEMAYGKPATITLARPDTFPRLADGPEVAIRKRNRQARKHLDRTARKEMERLVDYVCSWDEWYDHGRSLECSRSALLAVFEVAPWIRRQVKDAVNALNQSGRL